MGLRTGTICGVIIGLIVIALPVALISKARVVPSKLPRIHLIQNMDNQDRFKSQQSSNLFADRRAMRPPVSGTVARSELDLADGFHTGAVGEKWVEDFPIPVTDLLIQRGKERFEINCAPCHGYAGFGDGMVNKRAEQLQQPQWIQPSSFHTDEIRNRANGHIFNTITNGIRTMPSYRDKLSPKDRWAVVAYVRALQRSQNATLDDIPQDVLSDQN